MFALNHDNFILHTIFQTISIQKIDNKFTKNRRTKIIGSTSKNRNTKYQKEISMKHQNKRYSRKNNK